MSLLDVAPLSLRALVRLAPLSAFSVLAFACRDTPVTEQKCAAFQTDLDVVHSFSMSLEGGVSPAGTASSSAHVALSTTEQTTIKTKLDQFQSDHQLIRAGLCSDFENQRISGSEYSDRTRCADDWLRQVRGVIANASTVKDGAALQAKVEDAVQKPACL